MSADLAWRIAWWSLPVLLALVLLGGLTTRRAALRLLAGAGPPSSLRHRRIGREPSQWREVRRSWKRLRIASHSLLAVLVVYAVSLLYLPEPGELTLLRVFAPQTMILAGVLGIETILRGADPLPEPPRKASTRRRRSGNATAVERRAHYFVVDGGEGHAGTGQHEGAGREAGAGRGGDGGSDRGGGFNSDGGGGFGFDGGGG